ncbi:MAG: hypothetical protein KDH97_00115 [Calditrichaeota bacterium]|nr:hypothetical protein [Calditrichota bacterium]MCB9088586.1 hypothetical protein [Calditrichia bacterium]MCB0288638.1 hypothetical protein [Calditrichota bacterium]MCB0294133.1 hypothetical protein [Calditrichota bacterium]MCB0302438.1 hypothetical protein [Calditrichota bacterium]
MATLTGTLNKTVAGIFKRLKYFHGMLLSEEDFQDEQRYYREKLKLRNRFLHGSGVVQGLRLKESADPINQVTIEPGLAIDCNGNEILICKEHTVSLETEIAHFAYQEPCQSQPKKNPRLYIGIQYCECESDPVEQYALECENGRLAPQFSRVREGFCVRIFQQYELKNSKCQLSVKRIIQPECGGNTPPGKDYCPGAAHCCADEHFIILGYIWICGEEVTEITSDKIFTSQPRFLAPLYLPPQRWADAKLATYQAYQRANSLIDISGVIGMSVDHARRCLKELLAGQDQQIIITLVSVKALGGKLNEIRDALPYADLIPGGEAPATIHITLVTEALPESPAPAGTNPEKQLNVLFAYQENLF